MLCLHKQQTLAGDVTVYEDHQDPHKYYYVPSEARFHRNDDGSLNFRFLKYRNPVDLESGDQGGGYCVFATELVLPDEKREKLRSQLQEQVGGSGTGGADIKIATPTFTAGSVDLLMHEGENLVESVQATGEPSLIGNHVATFNATLSPEGARFFESGLQGEGGFVAVNYDLQFYARLPTIRGFVKFDADSFYDFTKERETVERKRGWVNKVWNGLFGGRTDDTKKVRKEVRETLTKNDIGKVEFDFPRPPNMSDEAWDKLTSDIREWGWTTLEEAVKRMAQDGIKKVTKGQKKVPKDVTDFEMTVDKNVFKNFRRRYNEQQAVQFSPGTLGGVVPNITNLKDADGTPIQWSDYASTVDLDDPFFDELNVQIRVNADFESLPLHSVEVEMDYPHGDEARTREYAFDGPDTVHTFQSRMADGKDTYRYSYQVNYQGQAAAFQSEVQETDERVLTVGVDDVGILLVDVEAGDLNFEQVDQVQVTLRYDDSSNDVSLIERQFTVNEENSSHQLREVILAPVQQPYEYRMKYFMSDGREYEVAWKEGKAETLYVNDPFRATRTYSVRAIGDLKNDIQDIFLDLEYRDETNDYTKNTSIALNSDQSFHNWEIPVIDEAQGSLEYGGMIVYQDGTQEKIPSQETDDTTIMVGERVAGRLEVQVVGDLIDWTKTKLVKVDLQYEDSANGISEDHGLIFRKDGETTQTWTVDLEDKQKKEYSWKATFYMKQGEPRSTKKSKTSQSTLVLEMPDA